MSSQPSTGMATPVTYPPPEQASTGNTMVPYTFPQAKLKLRQTQPGRTPLVLVACGSFSRKLSNSMYTVRVGLN